MEKQRYLPSTDEDRLTWHSNYQAKLATYAVKYNIPAEEVKQAGNDNQHLAEIIVYRRQFNDFARAITQYKNGIMNDTATLQPLVIPSPMLTNPAALPGISCAPHL